MLTIVFGAGSLATRKIKSSTGFKLFTSDFVPLIELHWLLLIKDVR